MNAAVVILAFLKMTSVSC